MNFKKSAVIVLLSMLIQSGFIKAQESILKDLSYLYLEKLVAVAKENYPRVKIQTNQVDIAKSNLASQKASWLDPFSLSYIYRSSSTIDVVNADLLRGYQFGVSINPGTLLKKPYTIKSAKEELKIAESNQAEYDLQLEAEVKRRYLIYLQNVNILRLQTKMALDAESIFKDVKIRYEKSEVTFQDYNNASLALSTAYQNKIQAEAGLMTAKVSLEELLVKKLEEIK